jgi:hypothetical protein
VRGVVRGVVRGGCAGVVRGCAGVVRGLCGGCAEQFLDKQFFRYVIVYICIYPYIYIHIYIYLVLARLATREKRRSLLCVTLASMWQDPRKHMLQQV